MIRKLAWVALGMCVSLVIFISFHIFFVSLCLAVCSGAALSLLISELAINPGDLFSHFCVLIKFRLFFLMWLINIRHQTDSSSACCFWPFWLVESDRFAFFSSCSLWLFSSVLLCLALSWFTNSNDGAPHALQLYYTFMCAYRVYIYGSDSSGSSICVLRVYIFVCNLFLSIGQKQKREPLIDKIKYKNKNEMKWK